MNVTAWIQKWSEMRPELKTRIQTGALGAVVLLGVTLGLGVLGTAFVSVTLALAMTHEYLSMVLQSSDKQEKRNIVLGVVWLIGFFSVFGFRMDFEFLLLAFVGLFFYFFFN